MKTKRLTGIVLAVLFALTALPLFPFQARAEAESIEINADNFPDPVFRNYVLRTLNGNQTSMTRAAAQAVTEIDVHNKGITDLTGIAYFTGITSLKCQENQLTSLDLQGNAKLETLQCNSNPGLVQITLSTAGKKLITLNARDTQLETLDVSGHTGLKSLLINNLASLTELNTSGCEKLGSLNVSGCTGLVSLDCSGCRIGSIYLADKPSLKHLNCSNTSMTRLDVSNNPALESLNCGHTSILSLDISANTALVRLDINSCRSLKIEDFSQNTNLEYLDVSNTSTNSLDVSGHTALKELYAEDNYALRDLDCSGCSLTVLSVWHSNNLGTLDCSGNQLTSLELGPSMTSLRSLDCTGNSLAELDIGWCPELCLDYHEGTMQEGSGFTRWNLTKENSETVSLKIDSTTALIPGLPIPVITVQPVHEIAAVGGPATLSVEAEYATSYQWQYSKDEGVTWIDCTAPGSDSDTFSFTATKSMDGRRYRVIAKNDRWSIESDVVRLKLFGITAHPSAQTVAADATAAFSVETFGASLSHRWQYSKDGGETWIDCTSSGAGRATFSFIARDTMNGRLYRCRVSRDDAVTYSEPAMLTVTGTSTPPVITAHPSHKTVTKGKTVRFTVSATGPNLKYQWQYSKDNGKTWIDCASAGYNTAAFSFTAREAMNGRRYRCKVYNGIDRVFSNSANLTISDVKPAITSQPAAQSVAAGKTAKFTVAAAGSGLKYQWQYSKDNGKTWTNCKSAGYDMAAFSFKPTASMTGRLYRCKVSNSYGSVTSSDAKLTVK